MSKTAVATLQTRTFEGAPAEIWKVREFVRRLVSHFPAADDVILLSSEVATNAVVHTKSGAGGTFTVYVLVTSDWVRVEVHDFGSGTVPAVQRSGEPGESGAGLSVVDVIADRWGFHDGQCGRVVWFEMDWQ